MSGNRMPVRQAPRQAALYLAQRTPAFVRSLFSLLFLLAATCLPAAGHAQSTTVCGPAVKEEVARLIAARANASEKEQLALQAELYTRFQHCAQDGAGIAAADPFYVAARQCGAKVAYLGSTPYEDMPCCGYDPQRRQFACPVKIKQSFGFGAPPIPGSREHVLHCVADAAGAFVPVGQDSVHLANEALGAPPSWQFGTIAAANRNLHTVYPMSGATRTARSILSWAFVPTDCDYKPIWGNVIDYRIRLNQ